MRVPLYDHAEFYREHRAEIDGAIARVLGSGRIDWGDETPSFEEEFAAWVKAKFAIAVGSGTAALTAALRAIGVGPGDEVITVANTDLADSVAIHAVGASVVWVDIDPETRCIDTAACDAAITSRTRALLPIDMYGHPADMEELRRIADSYGIALIEDACIALGAEIAGRRVGTLADVTCFSFSPGKNLSAYGLAGACTTEDATLADSIHQLSSDGQARERHDASLQHVASRHETEGSNERMDEIQAAVLRTKLPYLEATQAARRAQAERYSDGLGGYADLPREKPDVLHAWRNYVIEHDRRDALAAHLHTCGIGCGTPYSPPQHRQPVYANLGYTVGSLPQTERSGSRLLALPIGPHLSLVQIDAVIDAVRDGVW
jgi:dTDP-3-amino-3,4,6-trideoxy-alpha-D-glucose transaminase